MRTCRWLPIGLLVAFVVLWCLAPEAAAADIKLRHRVSLYTDAQQQPLNLPEGVCAASAAELIVADTGNRRLLRYEAGDPYAYRFVSEIELPPGLYPTKIQVGANGRIFVLDRKQMRVVGMDPAGGNPGRVNSRDVSGESVQNFALDGEGSLYLMGVNSGRIRVLGSDGALRREISPPADPAVLLDLTVDRSGRVLAVDGVSGVVYAAGPSETALLPITGSLKQYARFPSRIATDDRGRIYLSDRNGCRIVILGQDGSFLATRSARGTKDGLLQYPAQISISGETLLVADTRNHRVQVFTLSE